MSNEFKVGVKLHVDSTQYTAEFTKAGQTAQAFAAQVSGSATGAAQGVQSIVGKLDGLGQAASNGNTAAAAIDRITFSGRQAAVALGAIPQPLTGAAAHFQTAQAGLAGVARQGDAVKAALNGGIPAAKAFGAAADSASQQAAKAGGIAQAALGQTTISARQTAAALRGVPAQFTDIVTSIQGGQAPLTVLLQQGGQLKDMFGGAIPAAKALTGYVFGLVNPLTLAAAAAGVLALAYYQGSQEADGYRASIVMSGNAAGTTVGQLTDMARAISEVTGTQGAAAAALTQMAGSGAVARENLQQFTQTAMGLEKYVGQPVKATVSDLEQLGKAPLQASLKLNEQYHHLTVAVYEHIRALDEQGRKEEAGAAAQQAYMAAMEARKNEMVANLGYIERAWMGVASAAKGAWDWMLGVGRATTDQQNLAQLRENLARQQERNASLGIKDGQATADLKEQIRLLEKKITLSSDNAAAQAQGAKAVEHEAEWTKIVNANKSKEKQQEEEIERIRNAGKAARKDQLEIEREIAAYKARVADKGAAGVAARELERQRSLMAELAGLSGDFYKEWESLTKQFQQGKITQEDLVRLQAVLLSKQPAMVAVAKEEQHLLEQRARAWQEIQRTQERAQQQALEAMQRSAKTAEQQVQRLQEEEAAASLAASANIPLAEAVERVALARAEDNYQKALGQAADGATLLALQKEIDARREIVALVRGKETREGIKKTADEAEKELKRVTEQYEQGLTNAAMQGGKSLREYIHGMLRATAFRIVLDPVMKPLAGFLAGATGSGSVAASQGGGIMGTANLLSSAYSALTTGVSSSITAGFAKLAGSSFGQSIGLSNSSAIMGNNPSAFVPAGGQLTPLGQSIGTGLGMLGSGLAGYGISSAISNGYTTGGNTVNVLSGIASAIPGIGPIAGVIGGLINRAFGRKLKDTGIEGTIGGTAGFEGNSYQFYKGGWFRSDKTVRGELDAGVDKSLDTAVKQMQLSMAGLAMSIGAPTEAISGFSQAIKLSFNGLDEAGIQEKITQTLADYNEALASAFIASVDRSEVPKWVDRLLGNVDASAVQRLQAVAEWPEKLLQRFGTSRDQLAQLYAEGLANGDASKAGQAVADSLVASIEASLLGNASAQVFDIVSQGIMTPMLDAALLGQNVAEALSQASIQKTVERAKATAAAFAELWNNADFSAALEEIRTTVGSALGEGGAALDYTPRYTAAIEANTAATQAGTDANREAEEAARRIADERKGLQNELDELTMTRVQLLAKERSAIDASNQALWDQVQAAREAKAVADERKTIQDELNGLADTAAQALARQRDALHESNRALFDQVQALRLQQQLLAEVPTLIEKYTTDAQRQASGYARIAADLGAAGIGVSAEALMGATKAQIAQAVLAIHAMGSTSDETRLALVRAASGLSDLKDAATSAANTAADAALSSLQRSIEAEKSAIAEAANARIEALRKEAEAHKAAQETAAEDLATASRIADALGRAVRTLRGQVESTAVQDLAAARRFIEDAARAASSTGVLPDEDALGRAIESVMADQQQRYATYADWEAAQLDQANQLAALGALGESQMTVAERQLAATKGQVALLEEQIKATQDGATAATLALDEQLKAAQERLAVLRDSNAALKSIAESSAGFEAALARLAAAQSASAVGGGGGGGGGGNPGTLPGPGATAAVLSGPGGSQYDARTDTFYAGTTGMPYSGKALGAAAVDMVNAGQARALYDTAVANGVTAAMLAQWTGTSATDLNAWAREQGLPAFAQGTNYVPRDMLALVHEGEEIVPKRYNPAAQGDAWTPARSITARIGGGGAESALQAVVATLAGAVDRLASGNGRGLSSEDSTNLRRMRVVLEGVANGQLQFGVTAS